MLAKVQKNRVILVGKRKTRPYGEDNPCPKRGHPRAVSERDGLQRNSEAAMPYLTDSPKMGPSHQKRGPLSPRLGRPRCGVAGTFPTAVHNRIDELRPGVGGWGAITLRVELGLDLSLQGQRLPSVRSINRYLKDKKRVRPYRQPRPMPDTQLVIGQHPHDVWQMDAEGNKQAAGIGTVCVVNVKDTFSKTYVQSYPLELASAHSHPKTADYQRVLRLAWMEFGMNNCLQLDHESVFYDNTHASPFPTPFCLWSIALGNQIIYTPGGKPYKQGAAERSHQTMDRQVCQNKSYPGHAALFAACQSRRKRLNLHIPCRTLKGQAPLEAHPAAKHSGKYYSPLTEEQLFDVEKIYAYLAQCKPWYRTVTDNRTVALGSQQYFLKDSKPGTELAIRFDLAAKQLVFCDQNQGMVAQLLPKGLGYKDLAGDIDGFISWVDALDCIEHARPDP